MEYKVLKQQSYSDGIFKIVPIRFEDRHDIMKWRNEQMYHLRQDKLLTVEDQENYFNNIVSKLFDQDRPSQILFSYLKGEQCIGYGGLVHINWIDCNAEISFIVDTSLEKDNFNFHWNKYLKLIEQVAFDKLNLHKIYTYAFDLRPHLYVALENSGYVNETILKEHCFFQGEMKNVFIHSKWNSRLVLAVATEEELQVTYKWAINPEVRKYAFNQTEIQFEEHKKWFYSKINNDKCLYLILKEGRKPIGSIRFDFNDDKTEAVISYLIDPCFHGNGFGTKILQLSENFITSSRLLKNNITLIGFVIPDNSASSYIFKKLKYQESLEENGNLKYRKEIRI